MLTLKLVKCLENLQIEWKTLHKKWSFPLRISSVNVTKSAGNCKTLDLTSIKQTALNKQGSTHTKKCYKLLVHIFVYSLIQFWFYMSSHQI